MEKGPADIPDWVNDPGEAFIDLVRILDSAAKPDSEHWNIVEPKLPGSLSKSVAQAFLPVRF